MFMTPVPEPEGAAQVRDAVKRVTAVAALPEVTARVLEIIRDPKSTPAELHSVVAQDPALAARVLKIVNSAFYRSPGMVGSIDRAIVVLGLNAIKNIAISASVGRLFQGQRLYGDYTAKDLWRHSVAVAVTARELAKGMKLPLQEEAFLAGMLHDVGLLVLLELFPKELERVCAISSSGSSDAPLFCEAEREVIGLDHQEAGAMLAEQWKFPRPCQLVAGYHHRPMEVAVESRLLVGLVYVADTLCCAARHGFPLTADRQGLDSATMADVGLDAVVVRRVSSELETLVASASGLLE
jgi:HD-like signal output (HDOD) protein